MKFTDEIFKRASIRGVADYLLFGLAPNEDTRDYETRLDDTYEEFEKLALQCEKEKQFELLNRANAMSSEAASVYTEIGLQVGIMLMADMAQNTGKGNRRVVFHHNMKSGKKRMGEIKELLKLAADSMKNRTLYELLENDTEYQKRFKEEKEALKAVWVDEGVISHEGMANNVAKIFLILLITPHKKGKSLVKNLPCKRCEAFLTRLFAFLYLLARGRRSFFKIVGKFK